MNSHTEVLARQAKALRARGRIAAGVGATLMVLAVAALPPATAQAVTCYGDYCSGQDPRASGCAADGYTVASKNIRAARLELRWSPRCKTNWARYIQYPRGRYSGNVPWELRATQDTGYTQTKSYGGNRVADNTPTWSPMIYSPTRRVRAELLIQCGSSEDCLDGALKGQNPIVTAWR